MFGRLRDYGGAGDSWVGEGRERGYPLFLRNMYIQLKTCSYFIGQNSVSRLLVVAKVAGKCSFYTGWPFPCQISEVPPATEAGEKGYWGQQVVLPLSLWVGDPFT